MTTTHSVGLGGFFSLFELPPTIYKAESLERLGTVMAQARVSGSSRIPSGYVYLGQMIAHDITKLEKPGAQKARDVQKPAIAPRVEDLVQLRTPTLDLDCVYGAGFDDETVSVDKSSGEMRLGAVTGGDGALDDLPRRSGSPIAHIPDDRNDENMLLAQLHVLFLKLHNFFVRELHAENPKLTAHQLFDEARRQVILHYQQVVLYDFLDAVCDRRVWEYVIGDNRGTLWDPVVAEAARMPVELSAAALRFGHSMVRASYEISRGKTIDLTELFAMTGKGGGFGDKNVLPATHVVDWRFFFPGGDAETAEFVNLGLAIDPIVHIQFPPPNAFFLAIKNLESGNLSRLPDGQTLVRHLRQKYPDMARELNLQLLTEQQLNPEVSFREANGEFREGRLLTEVGLDQGFTTKTPLWYYLLAEAMATCGGQHLGALGSLLVADLIRALVRLSSPSVLLDQFESQYIVPTKFMHGRAYLTFTDLANTVARMAGAGSAARRVA